MTQSNHKWPPGPGRCKRCGLERKTITRPAKRVRFGVPDKKIKVYVYGPSRTEVMPSCTM